MTHAIELPLAMKRQELVLLRDAITTVRREIDGEEFWTRLGVNVGIADAFQARLAGVETDDERAPELLADRQGGELVVGLTQDDLLLVNNAPNEVLNGLPIAVVPARFRTERDEAERLLATVGSMLDRFSPHGASSPSDDRRVDGPG